MTSSRVYRALMVRNCLASAALVLAVTGVPMRAWLLLTGRLPSVLPWLWAAQAIILAVFVVQVWAAGTRRWRALRTVAAVGLFTAGYLFWAQVLSAPDVGNWWYWAGVIPCEAWLWWRAGERMRVDA